MLYNLIYFIRGDEHALGKLKDPGAAKRMQASLQVPIEEVRRYLSSVSKGLNPASIQQMFMRLESGLDIKKITQTSKFIKIGFLENVSDNILETIIKLTSHSSGSYQIKKNGELWINYADEDVLNLLNEVINEF